MSAAAIYIQGVDLLLKPPCLIKSQNFCLLKGLGDFFPPNKLACIKKRRINL